VSSGERKREKPRSLKKPEKRAEKEGERRRKSFERVKRNTRKSV